jgi:hypothetical protein
VPSNFTQFGFYDLVALSQQGAVMSGNLGPWHVLKSEDLTDAIPAMSDYLFGAPGMQDDCDVLLSSELLFYYTWELVRLARAARRYGLEPELVAFLPRQDRAAISGYLQNVRFHDYSQGVVDFLTHTNIPYFHYAQALQRVIDVVPDLPITVRSFETRFIRNGDILTDFLTTIDSRLDAVQCIRPAQPSNQGLLLEQYELLRVATILGRSDAVEQLASAEVTLSLRDRARIHAYYYRPVVQDFLTDNYLAGNHALVKRFMPHASAAERSYWRNFDPAPEPVTLDPEVFERLRQRGFG